ncbi:putative bifunctional diguanylate cyclase/phosphodiesterase [Aureimonas glaciei]|uniref:EAL domain-containing protein n=1 Tax=Aureimonas glaciei TaxID=1776957 RepID=A0A917DDB5_9HYPH|nr:EAL domain-containing protein [Aureimonas glaciei]GGD28670.1 hypothetical protein GCM10011335_34860 [Aureimonas glaciei]
MSLRVLRILLGITVGCFVFATAYLSVLTFERQKSLQQVARYDVSWSVGQALVEYTRLEQRIASAAIEEGPPDEEEVQLRFDILYSRMELLKTGEAAAFIREEPRNGETIRKLGDALAGIEPLIAKLETPAAVIRMIEILEPLDSDLAALASRANRSSAMRVAEDQKELLRLHFIFSGLAAGLIVCGIALIALLALQNRLLRRAQSSLCGMAQDLKQASGTLEAQNRSFDAALSNMSQGLCMFDAAGHLTVCNHRFGELFFLPDASTQIGRTLAEFVFEMGEGRRLSGLKQVYSQQERLIREQRNGSFVLEQNDGRSISITHVALLDGGWLATYEDVTERQRAESQIAHMAHFDSLTDLANRALFHERLEQALGRGRQHGRSVAVLCLDLDRFKDVNDSLGHHTGDELLKAVAERLHRHVGDEDLLARIGGDEFAILVQITAPVRDCGELCTLLIEAISRPFVIDGQEIVVGLSIGIADSVTGASSPGELLKQADLALYKAKADGKGTFRFFEPEMDEQLKARRALEADLRKALANDEMDVFYQPLVNAEHCRIVGFEALMRWRHPECGMVSPAEFIPIAEDTGLIVPLGEWVLRRACTQATIWPSNILVAVNLSAVQLRSGTLVQTVTEVLESTGLPAVRLELEITESVLMEDDEGTLAALHELRALGVRIAMDDFGTGYSSLSYLRNFPFDRIKIDQSFVRDLATRFDSLAIIQLITGLATSLSMSTTAEGVETEEQFLHLRAAGCTEVQGYYFARPLPAADLVFELPRPDNGKAAA